MNRGFIVIRLDPNDTTRSTVDSDVELNNLETIHHDDEQCFPVKMNYIVNYLCIRFNT